MKYYKAMRSWGDDFVSLKESELEKAVHAQVSGKVLIVSGGTIAGNRIEMIVPDYHKSMGWNYGYKMQPEDYADVKRTFGDMQSRIGIAGNRVRFLTETNQEHLIGLNVDIPELKKPDGLSSGIANKFKI